MEGVKRNQVCLMPHQGTWDEEYKQVQRKILEVWGENVLDIQHVGSTAIPSIWAKPILDVAVRLCSIERMNKDKLEELGYDYRGPQHGKETYHLFVLRGAGERVALRHKAPARGRRIFFGFFIKNSSFQNGNAFGACPLLDGAAGQIATGFKKQEKTKKDTTKSRVFFWRA